MTFHAFHGVKFLKTTRLLLSIFKLYHEIQWNTLFFSKRRNFEMQKGNVTTKVQIQDKSSIPFSGILIFVGLSVAIISEQSYFR